jgi:uncharacterized protein YbjQ (UPF0145 family)
MLVVAGEKIEGCKISEYKDIVFGIASSSEGATYRKTALNKLIEAAEILGANAVINFDMKIYATSEKIQEATAYGNAVVVDSIDGGIAPIKSESKSQRIDLSAYLPKTNVPKGKLYNVGDYNFVVCPKCGTKYKVERDEKGEVHIKGFEDVDDVEPGLQVFCLRCGTKFTVPEK